MKNYLNEISDQIDIDRDKPAPVLRSGNILSNGRLIVGVAFIVAILGIVYALTVKPIYAANILIQIRPNATLSGDPQGDIPTATEVEILRSRSILSSVVKALQLDIDVKPSRFPVVGAFIAEQNKTVSNPGLFGYGGYLWGAERVRVASFSVPEALLRQPFLLTIGAQGGYTLSREESGVWLKGELGELAKAQTKHGPVEILVDQIQAKSGAQFFISRSPGAQVVEQLQNSLAIAENGKQSNVIGISLRGSQPEQISRTLNAIGHEYIRRQSAQKSEEAKKALLFYDRQVQESEQRLQDLDARFSQVLRGHGISDLSEESRALMQQAVALQAELASKQQRRDELSSRFLENHPEVIIISKHVRDLRRDLNKIEARRQVLADAQHEILSVSRDKQITSEIRIALLNSRHKLDLLTQSDNASARLIDRAELPVRPVTLSLSVMIALACISGIVLGLFASFLKNAIVAGYR